MISCFKRANTFARYFVLIGAPAFWQLLPPLAFAQSPNLVNNPSLELCSAFPSTISQLPLALGYWVPTPGTPDYFHECGSGTVTVPSNLLGIQAPHFGRAYAGFGFYNLGGGWFEYIQAPLSQPLQAGVTYEASMWVSMADAAQWASDDFGFYFSAARPTQASFNYIPGITPQVKVADGNFIQDKINWVLISGTFVAQGGEQWLTIGCFEPWATTSRINVGGTIAPDRAYYYVDDVSVRESDGLPTPTPTVTPTACVTVTPLPTGTPTPTPTVSPSPSVSPTVGPSATPSATPSRTPSPTASPSATPSATPSSTPTASPSPTATASPSPSLSPTSSPNPTASPTPTQSPTASPSPTPNTAMDWELYD